MAIQGAIFDMDGTILDSLMFWDYLWQRIGEKYMNNANFKPCEEVDKNVRTMIYTDAMKYFKDFYKSPVATDDFIRFTSSGITNFYKDIAKVKAGAMPLLAFLKSQNIKLCLASATAMPEIRFALECHGLLKYFDIVLSCADIGVGKDRPDIYLKAMQLMDLPQNEICVFEDSYVALETAKKVGFHTVGVFDRHNFDQERLKNASDIYLNASQPLDAVINDPLRQILI